jgi:Fungal specific transcription factor domain
VKNIDNYNFLTTSGARWSFEPRLAPQLSEHRRPQLVWPTNTLHHSPKASVHVSDPQGNVAAIVADSETSYNTAEPPVLRQQELRYLQHYLEVVAPILDLFDPQQHFKIHVLHLALRNVGLLKSVLALSALYMSRCTDWHKATAQGHLDSTGPMLDQNMATQYYYETLGYLSQAMQYPGYPRSQEILANASLISWYEALDTENSTNWERHLKGVFWIQRSQNTNGEAEGLRKAVWWNWLRQDIWAAFRHSRKTLTIWRPTKSVQELNPEELACRALYLQAKAVGYASDEVRQSLDFGAKLQEGNDLLEALDDWYSCLPRAFRPLPSASDSRSDTVFPPIWIHPPIYAAAMQAYYSAKILILLNRPSLGGRASYHDNQKTLDDCVASVCGIAQGPNAADTSLAFVNSQALFFGKLARTPFSFSILTQNSRTMCSHTRATGCAPHPSGKNA